MLVKNKLVGFLVVGVFYVVLVFISVMIGIEFGFDLNFDRIV